MLLPNQLTVLRIVLSPVFLYMFLSENLLLKQLSIVVFIIAALTDWYDGWLARKYNYITEWGQFWDPLADKILTSFAFFGFVFTDTLELWMVLLIIFRDLSITILRIYAGFKGFNFSTSLYAKIKTFIQMAFLYYLILAYAGRLMPWIYNGNETLFSILLNDKFIYYAMLIVTFITIHSGVSYLFQNRLLLRKLIKNEA